MNEVTTPFCSDGVVQRVWDSTSMGWYAFCPRSYYYKMIEGYQTKHTAITLLFGIAYHEGLGVYYKAKADGKTHEEAQLLMTKHAFSQSHPWAVLDSEDATRCKKTLTRCLIWYTEKFVNDPYPITRLGDKPAIELSFRFELPFLTPDSDHYMWAGHLDTVRDGPDGLILHDYKTTSKTINSDTIKNYSPDFQMSGYLLSGAIIFGKRITRMIVDICQTAVGFARFHRGFVSRTDAQLQEFVTNLHHWILRAEADARLGFWPMNTQNCWRCPFREVCSQDPNVRHSYLKEDFIIRRWNPAENRD